MNRFTMNRFTMNRFTMNRFTMNRFTMNWFAMPPTGHRVSWHIHSQCCSPDQRPGFHAKYVRPRTHCGVSLVNQNYHHQGCLWLLVAVCCCRRLCVEVGCCLVLSVVVCGCLLLSVVACCGLLWCDVACLCLRFKVCLVLLAAWCGLQMKRRRMRRRAIERRRRTSRVDVLMGLRG
jgi:hypothetical protein